MNDAQARREDHNREIDLSSARPPSADNSLLESESIQSEAIERANRTAKRVKRSVRRQLEERSRR